MQRQNPKLVVAEKRLAEAGRIVVGQRALIEKLKESKLPTLDAERSLQMYVSSLTHLLAHQRKVKESMPHTETLSNNDIRRQRLRRQGDSSAELASSDVHFGPCYSDG